MLQRPRRNRRSAALRSLVRETHLLPEKLIYPMFLLPGSGQRQEIASLPGNFRLSKEYLLAEIEKTLEAGIRSVVLFPAVPEKNKDKYALYAAEADNFYLQTARRIKELFPELCLISDVAMDPYSSDGHDGLVLDGRIDNDQTLPILANMAVAQAQAGFDLLGPSDMMDGRVGFMRRALDEAGYSDTGILAYTAKYASAFYGPFRDALESAPKASEEIPANKKTYQMDPANAREAVREAQLDTEEGADMLMVKPALHYLDIIRQLKDQANLPVAAYHVSGECAMLIAAARNGWLDLQQAMPETLQSIHRAGADVILTYFARDYAHWYQSVAGK